MKALLIGLTLATLCMTAGVTNEVRVSTQTDTNAAGSVWIVTNASGSVWIVADAAYGTSTVNQITTPDHITAMREDGNLDAVIKSLADSGDICRVLGHSWGMSKARFYAVYAPDISYRTCRICGKQESQSMTDWE